MPGKPSNGSRGRGKPKLREVVPHRFRSPGEGPYRRGDVVVPHAAVPKEARELGIRVNKIGIVEWPRYKAPKELDPVEQVGSYHYKSMSTAERGRWHVVTNVTNERDSSLRFMKQLIDYRNALVQGRMDINDSAVRHQLYSFFERGLTFLGNPQKPSKKKAKKGFEDAHAMTKLRNISALKTTLMGVSNNLALRVSALNIQLSKIPRTTVAAIARFHASRVKRWGEITLRKQQYEKLNQGKLTPTEARWWTKLFAQEAAAYGKNAKEGGNTTAQLQMYYQHASDALGRGDYKQAAQALAGAVRWHTVAYGGHYGYTAEMIRRIATWTDYSARETALYTQVERAADNLEYWDAQEKEEGKKTYWVAPWLRSLEGALRSTPTLGYVTPAVGRASRLVEQKKFSEAKQLMDEALAER